MNLSSIEIASITDTEKSLKLENFERFLAHYGQISRLSQIGGLLGWDQQTYMPPGATTARGEQVAVLSTLIHNMAVSSEAGDLISKAEAETTGLDADSDEVRMLKVARREYDRQIRLPAKLIAERSRHQTVAMTVWQTARANNDFKSYIPTLEKTVDIARQLAEYQGYTDHPYDALLDAYEVGATRATVGDMFNQLTPELIKLTTQIKSVEQLDDSPIYGNFSIEAQKDFTLEVATRIGFDSNRGRQDEAVHPFCSGFSRDDVRITTRYSSQFLQQALYASLHEAGHAMYEQGIPARLTGTPLEQAASLGIHESQSRLWENQVGRSRAFANFVMPMLRKAFPSKYASSNSEDFYRAVNKSEPSLIRVEADEVTYNLHIALRFELECAMISGEIAIKDLPEAWNEKMRSYLGIVPPDDAQGVLQDVHWAIGLLGYFPTYSIGNLVSAQLWEAAESAIPNLTAQIEKGNFHLLLDWLHENVHACGSKYLPAELVARATGRPLSPQPYINYLNRKYSDIYGL